MTILNKDLLKNLTCWPSVRFQGRPLEVVNPLLSLGLFHVRSSEEPLLWTVAPGGTLAGEGEDSPALQRPARGVEKFCCEARA